MIELATVYKKMSLTETKAEIEELHNDSSMMLDEYKTVDINNILSLENEFDDRILGHGEAIYIPLKEKVYSFCLYAATQDINRCSQEFDKFLETVSID